MVVETQIGPSDDHMVQNHKCWDTICTVGLGKQSSSYQSSLTCFWFGSSTVQLASQHVRFCIMWTDCGGQYLSQKWSRHLWLFVTVLELVSGMFLRTRSDRRVHSLIHKAVFQKDWEIPSRRVWLLRSILIF